MSYVQRELKNVVGRTASRCQELEAYADRLRAHEAPPRTALSSES